LVERGKSNCAYTPGVNVRAVGRLSVRFVEHRCLRILLGCRWHRLEPFTLSAGCLWGQPYPVSASVTICSSFDLELFRPTQTMPGPSVEIRGSCFSTRYVVLDFANSSLLAGVEIGANQVSSRQSRDKISAQSSGAAPPSCNSDPE